ncbi:MAG: relaxase, partial [Gammaproteobacteria bacterium]|nr:relaxase [Gammaproteobacteria bacterium]
HGFMGLWHRITGVYQKIRRLNELETQRCIRRDRNEEQNLIEKQLEERGRLQVHVQAKRETHHKTMQELGQDIANYKDMQDFSDRIQYHKQEHAHTYQ